MDFFKHISVQQKYILQNNINVYIFCTCDTINVFLLHIFSTILKIVICMYNLNTVFLYLIVKNIGNSKKNCYYWCNYSKMLNYTIQVASINITAIWKYFKIALSI